MSRSIDVENWFARYIHEGYEKIPYRGRTGPGRRQWYKEFRTWPLEEQIEVVNTFYRLYNSITNTKKLDTARRIVARMTQLFQLVPWLKKYHRELDTCRNVITDYDELVSTVEKMFAHKDFPNPNIIRRLVDRISIMVRPKLLWKLVEKRTLDVTEAELKEQWEIFVSAKMCTHEFSDLFVWVLTMVDFCPGKQPTFLEKLKAIKAVLNHSFSGPCTCVRLMPLRALSNNAEVKDRLAIMLRTRIDKVDLKGVNAKENIDRFLARLIVEETARCEQSSMELDEPQLPPPEEVPSLPPPPQTQSSHKRPPPCPPWMGNSLKRFKPMLEDPPKPQRQQQDISIQLIFHVAPPMIQPDPEMPPLVPDDEPPIRTLPRIFNMNTRPPPPPPPPPLPLKLTPGDEITSLRSKIVQFEQQLRDLYAKQLEVERQYQLSVRREREERELARVNLPRLPDPSETDDYRLYEPRPSTGYAASTFVQPLTQPRVELNPPIIPAVINTRPPLLFNPKRASLNPSGLFPFDEEL